MKLGWHRQPPPPGPLLNRGGEWWFSSPPCQGGVGVVVVNNWPGQHTSPFSVIRHSSPVFSLLACRGFLGLERLSHQLPAGLFPQNLDAPLRFFQLFVA